MLRGKYRPWGLLSWILPRLHPKKWSVIGGIATGERCLSTWNVLRSKQSLKRTLMFEIHDEHAEDHPHSRFFKDTEAKLATHHKKFIEAGGNEKEISNFYLADNHGRIIDATNSFAAAAGKNVIIDVSALPKRFFFPMVKRLLCTRSIENLIAAYTVPERYSDAQLAEDPAAWTYLPTFLPPFPEPEERQIIVGLGYEALGLRNVVQGKKHLHFLFPFPSLSAGVRRNWEFVRRLGVEAKHLERVHIYDVSEIFDRISALTNYGTKYAILAPYGPKPLSLAMCLYAVAYQTHDNRPTVYYTQPRVYNPDYTSGVKMDRGVPRIHAYCLRLQGSDLYSSAGDCSRQ